MMRGLPASGKTTYARKAVKDSGNAGRVNRDDLRAMLFDSVWTGKREQVVIDCEKAIAAVLLKHQLSPIVDDTNLGQKHRDMWSNFAKEQGAAFVTHDMGVPVEVCRARDDVRRFPVGRAVIDRLALFNGIIEWGDKPIVLVDCDGTLANGQHREHHLDNTPKDWRKYYSQLHLDKPIDFVIRWVQLLSEDPRS